MVAVNSDVEFTSWEAQVDLLQLFAKRRLETAFSYWFFGDPEYTWHLFDLNLQWTFPLTHRALSHSPAPAF